MNNYFMAQEKEDNLNILIYGDITSWECEKSDVSSYTLASLIQNSKAKQITVCINSYGGETAEGLAIYNALRNHTAHVITRCDGFACSAASIVFMAGKERIMNEASLLMIHNAWTYAEGNAEDLRKEADALDTISRTAANVYLEHINITEAALQELLNAESWITPEEAVAMGFATSINREESDGRQQYSVRKHVMRQLASKSGEQSGFRKLFDTFIQSN